MAEDRVRACEWCKKERNEIEGKLVSEPADTLPVGVQAGGGGGGGVTTTSGSLFH